MEVRSDFKDLLKLFNSHGVEYLLVGAYALAHHGAPRYTGDLDLFINANSENARRVVAALTEFGFADLGLAEQDFIKPDQLIQLGVPPARVDIATSISGVTWDEAYRSKVAGTCSGIAVYILGRQKLIKNNRATGRTKDLADIEALGEEPGTTGS